MNKKKFINPSIIIMSLFLSYYSGYFLGRAYMYLHPGVGGGLFLVPTNAAAFFIGWPLQFVFLITLLFTIFGGPKKKWWIGISLAPVAVFWIFADVITIYFPIIIGLIAYALGRGIELAIKKFGRV
ncbi:MAG: hypothetical protein Q7R95_05465 [bacterium]|nr:hypothetical protein [bacterium]